ncbi:MAG: DUF4230 domain-containing protein [Spirochaetaceae bacterium]|nr:DUF4230 domain-containing protein [Spirochaetaceae bacterium]
MLFKTTIETDIHTMVKETLPVSKIVSTEYHYESVIVERINPNNILTSKKVLVVMPGTVSLGIDGQHITVEEKAGAIIIQLPPVQILSHEQHHETAKVYDESYGILTGRFTVEQILALQVKHKQEITAKILNDEALFARTRKTTEDILNSFISNLPGIKNTYPVIFEWQEIAY